jgi:hypothetical protein
MVEGSVSEIIAGGGGGGAAAATLAEAVTGAAAPLDTACVGAGALLLLLLPLGAFFLPFPMVLLALYFTELALLYQLYRYG